MTVLRGDDPAALAAAAQRLADGGLVAFATETVYGLGARADFGVKVGLTQVPDQGSYFGYGFDVNKSSIYGKHFYFGYGAGLKRLAGVDKNEDFAYIVTARLNVGVGF